MDPRGSGLQLRSDAGRTGDIVLRVLGKSDCVFLTAVERRERLVNRLGQLFRVAQEIASGHQPILFSRFQLRSFQLRDLVLKAVAQTRFFDLIHGELFHLLLDFHVSAIFILIQ